MKVNFSSFLHLVVLASACCLPAHLQAQSCNLVSNPSFDDQLMVPTGTAKNIAGSPYTQESDLAVWHGTDWASPDYFATNAPSGTQVNPSSTTYFGDFMPNNYNSTPTAHNGCVGLAHQFPKPGQPDALPYKYKEYISQTLSARLKIATSYYVSFYAYFAKGASRQATSLTLDLTANDPTAPNGAVGSYTPGQFSITSPTLRNNVWTKVSGIVTIPSTDSPTPLYVNIGAMQSTFEEIDNNSATFDGGYYYIDDIEIQEMAKAAVPNISYQCFGAAGVDIGWGCAPIPGATYQWTATRYIDNTPATAGLPPSPTSLNNHVYPTEPTIYTLTTSIPGSPGSGTITSSVVTYPSNWINITAQTYTNATGYTLLPNNGTALVCNGRAVTFTANSAVVSGPYNWTVNGTLMPTSQWYNTYSEPNDYDMSMGQNFGQITITPNTGNSNARSYTVTLTARGLCPGPAPSSTFTFYYDPTVYCRTAPSGDVAATPGGTKSVGAYPNPATDYLSLPAGVQQVQLLDAMGQPVLQRTEPGQSLDVRALPEGIYQLRTVQRGGPQTQRLVIKH